MDIDRIVKLGQLETTELIYLFGYASMKTIIANKYGILARYDLDYNIYNNSEDKLTIIDLKHKTGSIKCICRIDYYHLIALAKGMIMVLDKEFEHVLKCVYVGYGETILSIDNFRSNEDNWVCMLTRLKYIVIVTMFKFVFRAVFPLYVKKKLAYISYNIKRFETYISYPNKMTYKLKQAAKASINIKIISPYEVLLTGKLGEVCSLFIDHISDQQLLTIRPYSNEENDKQVKVWADSKHYKEIYGIYYHQNNVYMIATDHILTVWARVKHQHNDTYFEEIGSVMRNTSVEILQKPSLKYLYSIKFLTAAPTTIFTCEQDPYTLFFLLKDSIVRSCSPLDVGSHYLNEYWKFTKKYKIVKAVCHPEYMGVLCLATMCQKALLYDIYEDRLMKTIEVGMEIVAVSFENREIGKELERMFDSQAYSKQCAHTSYFNRELSSNTILLIQGKYQLFLIDNLSMPELIITSMRKTKKLYRIHNNKYYFYDLLLSSAGKQKLQLTICFHRQLITVYLDKKYLQGRYMFKSPKESYYLFVIGYKGVKVHVQHCKVTHGGLNIIGEKELQIPVFVECLRICYEDWRLGMYNQRDDKLVIMHLDRAMKVNVKDEYQDKTVYKVRNNIDYDWLDVYELSIKIYCMSFYFEDYLVIASKDQTIRVINYHQYLSKINSHKKNKTINKYSLANHPPTNQFKDIVPTTILNSQIYYQHDSPLSHSSPLPTIIISPATMYLPVEKLSYNYF